MNYQDQPPKPKIDRIRRRIAEGFYFNYRIYEIIAEKVVKEILRRK